MDFIKICLISVAAAIGYGILHDLVTAHICVEYFSIAHPVILPLTSPTLLALEWGILATWWVGMGLGVLLAISARLGSEPKLVLKQLYRPLGLLLICMGTGSFLAGAGGYFLARSGHIPLNVAAAFAIPQEKQLRFTADLWAHSAAYLIGMSGGLVLCVRNLVIRAKARNRSP